MAVRTALRCGLIATAVALVTVALNSESVSSQTLKKVRARGSIICGVNEGLAGFSSATLS
jgi:hypothetical protein